MNGARAPRIALDAVLLLDKPCGPSSNAALQRARRACGAAKAGHGGTLDPMASGLLPVAFGEATKFLHDLLDADKTYEATLRLGASTNTGDAEGTVTAVRPVTCTEADVRATCAAFQGEIDQVPPMWSALKRDGVPLYAYAREGVELEREARRVTVYAIEVLRVTLAEVGGPGAGDGMAADAPPEVVLRVHVSKGTYVRTLAHDLGERLGCGAHLVALRRLRVGALDVADAVPLHRLESAEPSARAAWLRPPDALLQRLPRVELPETLAGRFIQGQRLVLDTALRAPLDGAPAGPVRVYLGARLIGVADFAPPGRLAPSRVLAAR